jgi:hypothetical protein
MVGTKTFWCCAAISLASLCQTASAWTPVVSLKGGQCKFSDRQLGREFDLCEFLQPTAPSQTAWLLEENEKWLVGNWWKFWEWKTVTIRLGAGIEEGRTKVCNSLLYRDSVS